MGGLNWVPLTDLEIYFCDVMVTCSICIVVLSGHARTGLIVYVVLGRFLARESRFEFRLGFAPRGSPFGVAAGAALG